MSLASIASADFQTDNRGGQFQPPGGPGPSRPPGHRPPPPGYRPPQPPPRPPRPQPAPPSYGHRVEQIYIGRSVRNETIPLIQMAGLRARYQGWEIVSVRAQTRPDSPSLTVAQLISDGRIISEQRNPGYQIHLMPNLRVIVGQSTLQLGILGSTIIDTIDIELVEGRGGYNPGPNPGYGQTRVDLNIYRSLQGNDRLDLSSYVNMRQYHGLSIERIEIRGRADYNASIVDVVTNGNFQGAVQFNGNYTQNQNLILNQRPVIGRGVDSIELYTRGNMTVESVVLYLGR
jgi:hypothetical protein